MRRATDDHRQAVPMPVCEWQIYAKAYVDDRGFIRTP